MRSNAVSPGQSGLASQYNNLRDDAYGGSELLVHQQGSPNMTLYVEPGVVYIGVTRVIFGGGNSPTFTAPTSHPRIDILTIDSSGTVAITQGTEASSPVVPSYPANKAVLCEIYNRVGETSIKDADDSTNGYIQNDVRPMIAPPYISSLSQVASGLFIPDPGSEAQGDVLYYNGSTWARLPAGTSGKLLQTQGTGANPQWAVIAVPTMLKGSATGNYSTTSGSFVDVDATNLAKTITLPNPGQQVTVNYCFRYTGTGLTGAGAWQIIDTNNSAVIASGTPSGTSVQLISGSVLYIPSSATIIPTLQFKMTNATSIAIENDTGANQAPVPYIEIIP